MKKQALTEGKVLTNVKNSPSSPRPQFPPPPVPRKPRVIEVIISKSKEEE